MVNVLEPVVVASRNQLDSAQIPHLNMEEDFVLVKEFDMNHVKQTSVRQVILSEISNVQNTMETTLTSYIYKLM